MANIYNVLFLNLSHKVPLGKTVCVSVSFGKGVKKEDFKQVCDAKHRLVKAIFFGFCCKRCRKDRFKASLQGVRCLLIALLFGSLFLYIFQALQSSKSTK